jgi:hypothetical protein
MEKQARNSKATSTNAAQTGSLQLRTCSAVSLVASWRYCGRLASFSSAESALTAPGGRSRPAAQAQQVSGSPSLCSLHR